MRSPSLQLRRELEASLAENERAPPGPRRPALTHLNADTSWLIQLPRPESHASPAGRRYFNILLDPWFVGPQSDVASWFSQQFHAIESAFGSIAAVEQSIRRIEGRPDRECPSNATRTSKDGEPTITDDDESPIDAIAISHEFTDHCHQETLLEVNEKVPVFATKVAQVPVKPRLRLLTDSQKAAELIRSWSHFRTVIETPAFTGHGTSWRNTVTDPLPGWLGIARVASQGSDLLYYHSAILLTFDLGAGAEAIIYTPHGIVPDDLEPVSGADPPIRTLVLLHGLHDISVGRWQRGQLNLGAHNGLRAQRLLHAKYWVGTHDEIKRGGGIVSFFLQRKVVALKDALASELAQGGVVSEESAFEALREIHFCELGNGERMVLD
ncbi:MAG: hypothetical protein M1833_003642 [Piccolia ochrophora]|nr:MAG: hypothetical protein M1833_003642 [Piccolia ochrophora]